MKTKSELRNDEKMKAVVMEKYGDPGVLAIKEVVRPKVDSNSVLIRVLASCVHIGDPDFRKGDPFIGRLFTGLFKPKYNIPGDVLSGIVEQVGDKVKLFKQGDRVCAATGLTFGGQAEYIAMEENRAIVKIPQNMSFEEAAGLVDGAVTSICFIETAKLKQALQEHPQKILINGASGSVGSIGFQVAKAMGADVTAVCSTQNISVLKELGLNDIIDYKQEAFTDLNRHWDMIFDFAAKSTFGDCKKVLTGNGLYLTTVPTPGVMLRKIFGKDHSSINKKRASFAASGLQKPVDKIRQLKVAIDLYSEGELNVIIDKVFDITEIAEAHTHIESGKKKGCVIIKISKP